MRFTRDVFAPENRTLLEILREPESAEPARVLFFVDQGVALAWPMLDSAIQAYAARHESALDLAGPMSIVPGAEACKNSRAALEEVLAAMHRARLCRRSYAVVVGGGAVLDVVGFAAATAHRGVRLVRLPTTTLAQADSGIGVKNGVNLFGKKNYLGTFDVPCGVINDEQFLVSLSDRDWRCGFSEAVKVALVKDRGLFDHIVRDADRIVRRDLQAARPVIQRSCRLHFDHIVGGGDPFERDAARPLDFGHWAAHKLEQMTEFALRHGEAVAVGVALDVAYSAGTGLLPWTEARAVHDCLRRLGFQLYHPGLRAAELLDGLEEFREHLGGVLTIPVLQHIGGATLVHEMSRAHISGAIEYLADGHSSA